MTDAELIAFLRSLSHALRVAMTSLEFSDTARAKTAVREAQEGIDHAVYELLRRGSDDDTKR